MKKLVIVTTVPGTFSTILKGQPEYLSGSYHVTIISSEGVEEVAREENVNFVTINMSRGINLWKDIVCLVSMVLALQKIKPDLVHSYTPKAGLISMLAALIARVPVRIHTFTGLIFPTANGLFQHLLAFLDRVVCYCATKVIPEGEGVKSDLIKWNITNKPLEIIGNGNIAGVDVDYYKTDNSEVIKEASLLQSRLFLSKENFIFCYVGRLNKDKGINELYDAFCSCSENAILIIAGDIDQSKPPSSDILKSMQEHPRVKFLGFLNDVRSLMFLSDVLILVSYREGFPNVLLQAGAMELPCIVSDVNGSNEIIESFKNGWVVPVKNIPALLKAMKQAMTLSSDEIMAFKREARKNVLSKYERKEYLIRLSELYLSLIFSKKEL